MNASRFHEVFGDDADFWGEDPDWRIEDWQIEVSEDNTRLGYWDWVLAQRDLFIPDEEL